MNYSVISKWALLVGILLAQACSAIAQDLSFQRAQKVYDFLVGGQGDSIYVNLTKELQAQLSPAVFNETFDKTEQQFGKLQSKGEWQKEVVQGHSLYYADMKFERYNLRFLVSFDKDQHINTLRLMPVPAEPVKSTATYDKTKISEQDITIETDGFKLPGTLTLPLGKTKVPVVILVHGSGPNDRDETIGPNKPFRDLAWGLAKHGIAVIRYDKRTRIYGESFVPVGRQMDFDVETVDDALSAIKLAKSRVEIATDSVYILGHSQGGTLAPRIAERSKELAGIILLAGLARPLEDAIVEQTTYLTALSDTSTAAKAKIATVKQQALNIKRIGTADFDAKVPLLLNIPSSYWAFANAYKPVNVAAKLSLPILILQGERDYQVTMEDFGLWRTGLIGHKNVRFKSYPKLNHLMQEGSGKSVPAEYGQPSSIPDYVVNDVASFVRHKNL